MLTTCDVWPHTKKARARGWMCIAAVAALLAALHADSVRAHPHICPFPFANVLFPDSGPPLGFELFNISCDPETGEFVADASAFLVGMGTFWTAAVVGEVVLPDFVWKFEFPGLGDVYIFGSGGSFEWWMRLSDGTEVSGHGRTRID